MFVQAADFRFLIISPMAAKKLPGAQIYRTEAGNQRRQQTHRRSRSATCQDSPPFGNSSVLQLGTAEARGSVPEMVFH